MKNKVDETVIYLGQRVSKNLFRAFVYQYNNEQEKIDRKLVKTWDDFQKEISSGTWFATEEDAMKKSKKKRKS